MLEINSKYSFQNLQPIAKYSPCIFLACSGGSDCCYSGCDNTTTVSNPTLQCGNYFLRHCQSLEHGKNVVFLSVFYQILHNKVRINLIAKLFANSLSDFIMIFRVCQFLWFRRSLLMNLSICLSSKFMHFLNFPSLKC